MCWLKGNMEKSTDPVIGSTNQEIDDISIAIEETSPMNGVHSTSYHRESHMESLSIEGPANWEEVDGENSLMATICQIAVLTIIAAVARVLAYLALEY